MFHSIHGIFIHLSMAKITYLIKNEVNKSYEPDDKKVHTSKIILFPFTKFKAQLFPDTMLPIRFFFRIGYGKSDKPNRVLFIFHTFK